MTDSPSARHRWHSRKAGESPDGRGGLTRTGDSGSGPPAGARLGRDGAPLPGSRLFLLPALALVPGTLALFAPAPAEAQGTPGTTTLTPVESGNRRVTHCASGWTAVERRVNIRTFARVAAMFTFRTKIEAALLLAAASCPSPAAAEGQVEYPVTIPAQAPHFPERVSIRRLPDDADRTQLIDAHRMFRPEHRRTFLTLRTASWWLVIPPRPTYRGLPAAGAPRRGDRQRLPRSPARPGHPGIRDPRATSSPCPAG